MKTVVHAAGFCTAYEPFYNTANVTSIRGVIRWETCTIHVSGTGSPLTLSLRAAGISLRVSMQRDTDRVIESNDTWQARRIRQQVDFAVLSKWLETCELSELQHKCY